MADVPFGRTAILPHTDWYRHDLDGLRGIAIALVAVFHVWMGRVSGGVDVFLLLSGFFFGGSVLRTALTPGETLVPLHNLRRLVRRLVPALVVVLAASAVLTVLIQPQTRWEAFADQSLASLGYYQNWHLAGTASNYVQAGQAVSPLQHIWSMSVQGQFYAALLMLVFVIAYLLRRSLVRHTRLAIVVALSTLCVASFVYAVSAHTADQESAYYNSFARAWELLLGVLVTLLVPHIRWPMWLRTAVTAVALAAVLSCGVLIDGAAEYPGPWTLVPVGATVLIILGAANQPAGPRDRLPFANRLLATRPLIALGAMSYSLYLWHWPLLIFWLAHAGRSRVSFVEGACVLLASGVLAYLTTRFVENPLRAQQTSAPAREIDPKPLWLRIRRPTIALGSTVALLGVALTASAFGWRQHVIVHRSVDAQLAALPAHDYPGARALTDNAKAPELPIRPTVFEARRDLPPPAAAGCSNDSDYPALTNCTYGDPNAERVVAVVGASHAEHWIPALDQLGRQHHFKVVTYLKMGCLLTTEELPTMDSPPESYSRCHEWVQHVVPKLLTDRPDYVFTTTTRPRESEPGDYTPDGYLPIWNMLSDSGIGILGVRDTPWLVRDGQLFDPADCLAGDGDAVSCGVKRSDALAERDPTLDVAGRFPLLRTLDMTDALCENEFCPAVEGNVLIYRDSHHLSATYVRTLADELGRQIAAATGWWPPPRGHL
ncbi:acyltransferase [Mycobacterium sp. 21AC1]|uniref:acyltransferase family protein n=1 Tax=[Mycobacterium] appelbergii TaxID=2939269 RepID=UPI002938E671|nr:acyltransferase family protein [Mycobacterium sp. 21AC1]MDV3126454.1 acyltransferase [Mycobacterium sp. 21AC1]